MEGERVSQGWLQPPGKVPPPNHVRVPCGRACRLASCWINVSVLPERSRTEMATASPLSRRWSPADSHDLYNIRGWGNHYFSVNDAGSMVVHPGGPGRRPSISRSWWTRCASAGSACRCSSASRRSSRRASSSSTRRSAGRSPSTATRAATAGVYPIKVNQDRYLVERLVEYGRPYHFGLEAGSKPELLAVMAMLEDEEALIICNGYKDEEYIETALLASKLGRHVIMVVEKPSELPLIHQMSQKMGVRPRIGIRSRLSAKGAGHWEASGGDRSKFGLSGRDLLGRSPSCARTTCSTPSSSSTSTSAARSPRSARSRTACARRRRSTSTWSRWARRCAISTSAAASASTTTARRRTSPRRSTTRSRSTPTTSSSASWRSATRAAVPHPTIVSESGRATVAHHAVLMIDVLGVSEFEVGKLPRKPPADAEPSLRNLFETYQRGVAEERAGGLPRRHRLPRRVPEPVQPRPPVAREPRASPRTCSGRPARRSCKHRAHAAAGARGASRGWSGSSRTPTSATSRSSSRCPTPGRSTSSSRWCRSTA